MAENKESREFWEAKKQETGKDILFRSFARFIGEPGKGSSDLSGLLYATEDRVYFEDFEKNTIWDFLRKKKDNYQKFTMNFLVSDVADFRKVSESSAIACINGEIGEARTPGSLSRFFNAPAWEVKLTTGNSYFFELFEPQALQKLLAE